jgi:hypothetical protein
MKPMTVIFFTFSMDCNIVSTYTANWLSNKSLSTPDNKISDCGLVFYQHLIIKFLTELPTCALLMEQVGVHHNHSKSQQIHLLVPTLCHYCLLQVQSALSCTVVLVNFGVGSVVQVGWLGAVHQDLHMFWRLVRFDWLHLPQLSATNWIATCNIRDKAMLNMITVCKCQ